MTNFYTSDIHLGLPKSHLEQDTLLVNKYNLQI